MVVVFDLDDTLYFERDYQESGYNAVIDYLISLYPVSREDLSKVVQASEDVLQALANVVGIPSIKESLLWVYRLHSPNISLTLEAKNLLETLRKSKLITLILTDGRSVSQRLKIKSLELTDYPVYISDEFEGSVKPGLKRFKYIEEQYPASNYMYIGDNLKKDFIAPNKLGWLTLGLKEHPAFVHRHQVNNVPDINLPKFWIKDLSEVEEYLC